MRYLTLEDKEYYQREFDKFKEVTDEYWKIDPFLLPLLKEINKNVHIQTVFSSLYSMSFGGGPLSYLQLAVDDNYFEYVLKILNRLKPHSKIETSVSVMNTDDIEDFDIEDVPEHLRHLDAIGNTSEYLKGMSLITIYIQGKGKHKHETFFNLICKSLTHKTYGN